MQKKKDKMIIKQLNYFFALLFIVIAFGQSTVKGQVGKKVPASERKTIDGFKKVFYTEKRFYGDRINMFQFRDNIVTVEYADQTLFGIGNEQSFATYKSAYDLDLGELDLFKFDDGDAQIYLVELVEDQYFIYNIYLFNRQQLYYLGNLIFDLSAIESDFLEDQHTFNFVRKKDGIEIGIKNANRQIKKEFRYSKPLRPLKTYSGFQKYVGKESRAEND